MKKFSWDDANISLVNNIETSQVDIVFDYFKDICSVLGYSVEKVLKLAVFLRENEKKPEKELLKEIKEEIEFQLWLSKQKGQEESGE